jgi:hypothetical protein
MKRYRGVVVFRYYLEVEVEAEDEGQANELMYAAFNDGIADGESEILDFEEIKE